MWFLVAADVDRGATRVFLTFPPSIQLTLLLEPALQVLGAIAAASVLSLVDAAADARAVGDVTDFGVPDATCYTHARALGKAGEEMLLVSYLCRSPYVYFIEISGSRKGFVMHALVHDGSCTFDARHSHPFHRTQQGSLR